MQPSSLTIEILHLGQFLTFSPINFKQSLGWASYPHRKQFNCEHLVHFTIGYECKWVNSKSFQTRGSFASLIFSNDISCWFVELSNFSNNCSLSSSSAAVDPKVKRESQE